MEICYNIDVLGMRTRRKMDDIIMKLYLTPYSISDNRWICNDYLYKFNLIFKSVSICMPEGLMFTSNCSIKDEEVEMIKRNN